MLLAAPGARYAHRRVDAGPEPFNLNISHRLAEMTTAVLLSVIVLVEGGAKETHRPRESRQPRSAHRSELDDLARCARGRRSRYAVRVGRTT